MWPYLLKRLILFVPTIFLVSVVTFFLSKIAPGDPVAAHFKDGYTEVDYDLEATRRGLNKPSFYFSIKTAAYPDTLFKILNPEKRKTVAYLIGQYGNAESVQQYYKSLIDFKKLAVQIDTPKSFSNFLEKQSKSLFFARNEKEILKQQKEIHQRLAVNPNAPLLAALKNIASTNQKMKNSKALSRHLIPNFIWYGFNNQYHHWISNFLKGDFGTTDKTGRSVSERIKTSVYYTFIINIFAIFLAFGIAIPLGVKAAINEGEQFDKITTLLLYGFYSLPSFWVATLLILFFCSPEYGMNIFPSIGIGGDVGDRSLLEVFGDRAYHLVLPILCVTYPSLAFIYRQMRGSMVQELKKNYVRTARSKGLPESKVIWSHAFKNALFPIITMIASVVPALISGAVVIEVVFNIPGMGKLMVDSISEQNWLIVYTIMMMGTFFTILGILIADLLYAWLDPRIRF